MEMEPSAMRAGRPCTAHRIAESARSDTVTQNLNPSTLSGPPRVLGTTGSGPLVAQHLEFHWPVETASLHGHMRRKHPQCPVLLPYTGRLYLSCTMLSLEHRPGIRAGHAERGWAGRYPT